MTARFVNPLLPDNLAGIVEEWSRAAPAALALSAPGRPALDYAGLHRQMQRIAGTLSSTGVARDDRVAVVLPNGPEMAAAVVGVASCAVCAPLNPAYREDEFRFHLGDLGPKALLLSRTDTGPARIVARALGIRCLDAHWESSAVAGVFDIHSDVASKPFPAGRARGNDVALVLHTSGTMARPKVVPLTHGNLVASATNVAAWLKLRPDDCCLNLMPLFHIHGLVAALLASLRVGASVACTPGMQEGRFVAWARDLQPTWYTAVPSVHQAVLEELTGEAVDSIAARLRFVRSSSAPLPMQVARELEAALGVPVIEAYGMTEAAHQIACNPLPPQVCKRGSVGLPAGPEIVIIDDRGRVLGPGAVGEIAIRGENVTPGYEANPEANAKAFVGGWFRTGDLGSIDADGYLTITGRLKEIINRGGEKISPREIDEALLAHTAVREAIAFAVPHPTLGEDVAAAVVLRTQSNATEHELREYLFDRLARFKVPSHIVVTDRLPRSPTGKVQRLALAEQLAADLASPMVEPADETAASVAAIFAEVLGIGPVGAADNFFALGGDSLRGGQVLSRVQAQLGVDLPPLALFRSPTVAEFARAVEAARNILKERMLARALDRVEALSDEQAHELVARRPPRGTQP